MILEIRRLRRKRDWEGAVVKALGDIGNRGGESVRAGWIGRVTRNYKGLSITFDICKVCGTRTYVSGVCESEVEYLGHPARRRR